MFTYYKIDTNITFSKLDIYITGVDRVYFHLIYAKEGRAGTRYLELGIPGVRRQEGPRVRLDQENTSSLALILTP